MPNCKQSVFNPPRRPLYITARHISTLFLAGLFLFVTVLDTGSVDRLSAIGDTVGSVFQTPILAARIGPGNCGNEGNEEDRQKWKRKLHDLLSGLAI
jgi:hypothetical protein